MYKQQERKLIMMALNTHIFERATQIKIATFSVRNFCRAGECIHKKNQVNLTLIDDEDFEGYEQKSDGVLMHIA